MRLKNKTAIVTGAGRGLGKAIAKAFAKEGAHVMMVSLDENELQKAAREIEQEAPGKAMVFAGNVSRENDAAEAVSRTLDSFHNLDILVNNAGIIGPPRFLEDTDLTSWNATLGVNLTGYFLFTRTVLPHMVRQSSGKIINIVSGLGGMPFPRFCAYAVSKAGGIQLTKSVASEMEQFGIQVNAIDPGVMDTAMQDTIRGMSSEVLGKELRSRFTEYKKDRILKDPDEVAQLAVFLASKSSGRITGQIGSMKLYREKGWGSISPRPQVAPKGR